MRDALVGTVVITIIVIFIVFVSAYLAFNVNYTKAFKMKNKIISTYEEYNGECDRSVECKTKIKEYAESIGYKPNLNCGSYDEDSNGLYCYKLMEVKKNACDEGSKKYYKIQTKIDIRVPIVDSILGLQVFAISGDTKVFEDKFSSGNCK